MHWQPVCSFLLEDEAAQKVLVEPAALFTNKKYNGALR